MKMNDCTTESRDAIETFGSLLEQFRNHVQQHDDALIRMNVGDIEQHLATQQIICAQLLALHPQLGTVPSDIVEYAFVLRRLLHAHAALITKSRASALILLNVSSACRPNYPEQEGHAQMHA